MNRAPGAPHPAENSPWFFLGRNPSEEELGTELKPTPTGAGRGGESHTAARVGAGDKAHTARRSVNQTEFINTTGSVREQETAERLLIRIHLAQRWFIKPQSFSKSPSLLGGILLISSLKPDVTLSIIIPSPKNSIKSI